jgi:hypothetical protein
MTSREKNSPPVCRQRGWDSAMFEVPNRSTPAPRAHRAEADAILLAVQGLRSRGHCGHLLERGEVGSERSRW